jgi:hypothetical protein
VTATALIAGLITWAVWPEPHHTPPRRERQYKATTACLLTDDHGLTGDLAGAAWTGMQQASVDTHIKVQYLTITGPQTSGNGLSYYNTLGIRGCTVIIAAGPVPVAAMTAGHRQFRAIQHVAIGGAATPEPNPASHAPAADPAGSPTITTVPPDSLSDVQRRIQEIVTKAGGR